MILPHAEDSVIFFLVYLLVCAHPLEECCFMHWKKRRHSNVNISFHSISKKLVISISLNN